MCLHKLTFSKPLIFFTFFIRFGKQYSKEYKAKEVSEGEESKDFWSVLGGKSDFVSLSEGLYYSVWFIVKSLTCKNRTLNEGDARNRQFSIEAK